jgi:hypothetical protein
MMDYVYRLIVCQYSGSDSTGAKLGAGELMIERLGHIVHGDKCSVWNMGVWDSWQE